MNTYRAAVNGTEALYLAAQEQAAEAAARDEQIRTPESHAEYLAAADAAQAAYEAAGTPVSRTQPP